MLNINNPFVVLRHLQEKHGKAKKILKLIRGPLRDFIHKRVKEMNEILRYQNQVPNGNVVKLIGAVS